MPERSRDDALASPWPFVAGAAVLAVAMGIGRFAYTPLLVVMRGDAGLSVAFAGTLASANLAGYLTGALLAMLPGARIRRFAIVRAGAVVVVFATAAMALGPAWWLAARFVTGVASGLVFVLTASVMLDRIAWSRSRYGLAVAFSGVGFGIAGAGLLVNAFAHAGGSRAAWLGLAATGAALLAAALPALPETVAPRAVPAPAVSATGGAPRGSLFGWLAMLYGIEGAAYIIPATFLVAIVSENPSLAPYGSAVWIFAGFVCAPSTLWWNALADRSGLARAFVIACVTQAVTMLAPIALSGAAGALVLAAGLGATFVGITSLGTSLARTLRPANGAAAIGFITALYGVGQIAGPLVATRVALASGSYRSALSLAAILLGCASAAFAVRVRRDRSGTR